MNIEWLRSLIALVEESDIDSLEVERLTTRVRIRKSPRVATGSVGHPAPIAAPAAGPEAGPPAAAPEGTKPETAGDGAAGDGLFEVTSPMVGTFYRAPAPDAAPFVAIGDHVESGQTLCILEAMKLMNELQSEVSGTVREIAVENAEPVEFGAVLFRIQPD